MDNQTIVVELYDAFHRKDEARLRELMHPDIEWIQCAGFPGGASRRGIDEVIEPVFGKLQSEWIDWHLDIDEYLDAGTSIVVLGRYVGTHGMTKRAMEAVFAHVYDLAEGRITRFRQFTDTVPIEAATRARVPEAGSPTDPTLT